MGTPPQNLTVMFSMTSADTWVNSATAWLCKSGGCTKYGAYNSGASSTYRSLSSDFNMPLSDGTVSGNWITETLTLGNTGVTISGQQMGLALTTASDRGFIGLGYPASTTKGNGSYPTLLDQMVSQGRIKSPAYSLYMNAQRSKSGTILFGGVDTTKFSGQLVKLDVVRPTGNPSTITQPSITLTGLSYGNQALSSGTNYTIIISPETSFTYLPRPLITALAVAVNATFVSQYGMYTLPCPSTTDPRFITFTFSSAKIMVPIRELAFKDGVSGPCYLGVNQTRPGYPNFLGVSFLRSAYVVFDLARNTISLAQAVVNATSAANVLEIDDSPSPAAVTAVGQPAPPPPSGDFDVPVGDDSEGHGSKSGLAPGVIAGVVCGSLSVAVLGAFGALSFWRRRSRQRRKLETKLAD